MVTYFSFSIDKANIQSNLYPPIIEQFLMEHFESFGFENVINWVVEYDHTLKYVTREICNGVDDKLIYAAPTDGSLGMWYGSSLEYSDYQEFSPRPVSESKFDFLYDLALNATKLVR
jgi:hypothetical protein